MLLESRSLPHTKPMMHKKVGPLRVPSTFFIALTPDSPVYRMSLLVHPLALAGDRVPDPSNQQTTTGQTVLKAVVILAHQAVWHITNSVETLMGPANGPAPTPSAE
jgi:hypothetical protein